MTKKTQYKHKKTGKIATLDLSNQSYYNCGTCSIPYDIIENSCDWEEVKDKEYEILSFKDIANGRIYDSIEISLGKIKRYFCRDSDTYVTESCIEGFSNFTIFSIRRISDGEIFTVGDEILTFGGKEKIKTMRVIGNPGDEEILINKYSLKHVFIVKPILFTSEDGVEIKEGDDYYTVFYKNYEGRAAFKDIHGPFFTVKESLAEDRNKRLKFFSTKEAAEEYILYNKPCLSLKDVASIYPGVNKKKGGPSSQANRLIELVKSKL